jgi:hypothetical protein
MKKTQSAPLPCEAREGMFRINEGPPTKGRERKLQDRKIFIQFELGDMGPIPIPFDLFVLNKFLKDVISQSFPN